jgi:hypothetical protein
MMQWVNTTHFFILCVQELEEMTCQVIFKIKLHILYTCNGHGVDSTVLTYRHCPSNLIICWSCIVIYQYSRTNEMHFLYSVYYELTASTRFEHYLLILRRSGINNNWYIACVLCLLAATTVEEECMQYTNCCLCSASWRWASSARNM